MTFEEFYNKYFARVYNYCRYRAASADEADELSALVFEHLFKKFPSYNAERANIEVWLFTLARNALNDYYRKKKLRAFFSFDNEEELGTPDHVARTAEKNDEKQLLLAALARLEQRERELINLKHNQLLTNRDIAAVTGLSESNVGTILQRSMQKLRVILDGKI